MRNITFAKKLNGSSNDPSKLPEKIFRDMIQSSPDAIFIYVDEKIIFVNSAGVKLLRASNEDEIVGKSIWDFIPAERHKSSKNSIDYIIGNTKSCVSTENKLLTMDGEVLDIEISSSYINFDNRKGIQAFIRDITKRKNDVMEIKKAQDALMLSEERYRLLAENAKDIIIVYEENGAINYINNSGYEILGIKKNNKKPINIKDLLPDGKYLKPHDLIKNKEKDFVSYKNRTEVINFSGKKIKLEAVASRIKLDNDKYGILVVARDITKRKQLERELILISERIRQQVSRDLHDDLNPHLIGIEALTQVLYTSLKKNQLKEADEAEKISALINKAITKIHRLERGLCPVDLESLGIQTPLMNLIKLVRSLYGIECKFTYDESIIIEDMTLATNLYYIAQEAIINAARHSGGSLITITLKQTNNMLLLSIKDNGYGINKKSDSVLPPAICGMGLEIMKYRAEIIAGVFSIRKNKPSGTIISVNIPISILKSEGRISYDGRLSKNRQETADIYR
ncbi:MAG: PAS domain S-box protein [Leptospirales bacterium]|nr:PAS domain S-box protein [Leptospirales bacterium]